MTEKEQPTGNRDEYMDGVDISALVNQNLTAAMVNLFEAHVIRSEIFPAVKVQIARARSVIREAIWDEPELDTVVLLTSELATNAVLHSGSSFFGLILARLTGGDLRVAVTDEGRKGIPSLQQHALASPSGRGVYLVDTLAQRWGITRQPGVGVAVWFDVP